MPIIVGDKPIFRIKYKDADIREVRKATELEGGLYKITYRNGYHITIPTSKQVSDNEEKNLSEYVWGYPNQSLSDFYLGVPGGQNGRDIDNYQSGTSTVSSGYTDDKAYLNGGNMKSSGGFNNNECKDVENDASLSYIKAITRDFNKDLTLYCKGTLRQYCFSGTCTGDIYEQTGSSPVGLDERTSAPLPNDSPYPGSDTPKLAMPNCTGYATGRAIEAFGSAPVYGDRAAKNGISGGYDSDGTKLDSISQAGPGDIIVYNGNSSAPDGHVAFVEPSGNLSGSGGTNVVINGTQTSGEDSSGHWYNYRNDYGSTAGDLATYVYNYSSNYRNRYGHTGLGTLDNLNGEFSGTVLGVLHYTGSGGGGGSGDEGVKTGTGSYSYSNIVCGNSGGGDTGTKLAPMVPEVYDQADQDANPGTHGKRNQRGNITTYTNENDLTYSGKNDTTGSGSGGKYYGGETHNNISPGTTGLAGGYLDW